jgi:CopG family nickel-responsive transcriptional regulator
LAALHDDHHDITVAATHAHLDHDHCIETVILRGKTDVVTRFAESVIAEKGVRHGKFNAIPVEADTHAHSHGAGKEHRHRHVRPRT